MRARLLVLLVGLALVSACGSGGGPKIAKSKLPLLVLQPADLPKPFVRFDEGKLALSDIQPGPRADQKRFGHEGGWKARYHRAGTASTPGPLVVGSFADLFGDSGGARKDLRAYRVQLAQEMATLGGAEHELHAPKIGDDTVAAVLTQFSLREYRIFWRYDNATASVLVQGLPDKIAFSAAVALARKQQRRIAAAARTS